MAVRPYQPEFPAPQMGPGLRGDAPASTTTTTKRTAGKTTG